MTTVELRSVPVVGALSEAWTDTGVSFHRLPRRAMKQMHDPVMAFTYATPVGVRMRFRTDADALELDVMLTLVQTGSSPLPAVFDLVAEGTLRSSVSSTEGAVIVAGTECGYALVPGSPTTVRFEGLRELSGSTVEVWFPHTATVELRAVRLIGGGELAPVSSVFPRWVHYGSSISHCAEAPTPTRTWPALVSQRLGLELWNLAASGQCQLDQGVARTIRDLDTEVISVKAGVNMLSTMRERTIVPALHGFLDTVREGHPTTPIVVATPIVYPAAEDCAGTTVCGEDGRYRVVPMPSVHAEGSLTMRRVRELVSTVVRARQREGDTHLHLLDGLMLFGTGDADELHDGLHPNAEGYVRIAERFAPALASVMEDEDVGRGPSQRGDHLSRRLVETRQGP